MIKLEKNLKYTSSDISEISKGILNSFIMESAAPAAGTKMTAAMEAADDTDAAEDDDLFDDAENDDSLDEEDVFIAEIDGDDDPCEEEDDFYDSVIESIDAESFGESALEAVTEGAEVDEEAEYEQVLEDAVYALKQMPEDEIVKVLESLSPDTVQDLIAMEDAIDNVALVMEDCDDDDCDDEECEDCDEDEDDKPKKKDDKKGKDKKDDEDEDAENDKINAPIKVNSFSTVLNPVGTFEEETADDYLDLFDDDDDDYDDL